MKLRIILLGAAVQGALPLLLPSCNTDVPPATHPIETNRAALAMATSCVNGDLGDRSKLFNETTLKQAEDTFATYFAVDLGAGKTAITNTVVSLSIDKLKHLRGTITPAPTAIAVHYGLLGDAFYPVFSFRKRSASGAYAEPIAGYYLEDSSGLVLANASKPSPALLMSNYAQNVRIHREGGSSPWSSLDTSGTFADPTSEWFRFDYELDRLIAESPTGSDMMLVLRCISERVCYSAAKSKSNQPGQGDEFRHLIAWNIADSSGDLLNTDDLDAPRGQDELYFKRAVDLGHLCPPRCK